MKNQLTLERLRELMHYHPDTGYFTRLVTRGRSKAGNIAGTAHDHERTICIDRRHYRAHRLAWLYMTGEWPPDVIDHIDGDPLNNRWSNLRAATRQQNQCNMARPKNNTSGYKGVSLNRRRGDYHAYIDVGGQRKHIGFYPTAEAAFAARSEIARELHGDFMRLN